MKWQKNTGVMPCDLRSVVAITYDDKLHSVAIANDVRWEIVDSLTNIEYYCIIGDMPNFDYVEPKVWTVQYEGSGLWKIYRLGVPRFAVHVLEDDDNSRGLILDALNAMEERNGTV
jgi:hypothetical protein